MFTALGAKAGRTRKIFYGACWILVTRSETDLQTTLKDLVKFRGWVSALLPGHSGEPAPKRSRFHRNQVPAPKRSRFHRNQMLSLNPGNFLPSTIARTIAKEKWKRGMYLQATANLFFP